jgi:excisionase family DNA binding protein
MRRGEREDEQPAQGLQAQQASRSERTAMLPFRERLTCTIAEACEATGLGRTKLYELIGQGCLETTTIGRRRLVLVRSLFALLSK